MKNDVTRTGNFDRVALVYDTLAGVVFGGALRAAQAWAVANSLPPGAQRILFIGGGTGWVLPAVLARAPAAQVVYLEASAAMLARARAHLARTAPAADQVRVEWRCGTEAVLRADGEAEEQKEVFDAVLTFFFLDLFGPTDLPALLARLTAHAAPEAAWLVADFAPPRTRWQRALLAVMYRFFRLTTGLRNQTLPDWPAALQTAGWQLVRERAFVGGAVRAGAWRRG